MDGSHTYSTHACATPTCRNLCAAHATHCGWCYGILRAVLGKGVATRAELLAAYATIARIHPRGHATAADVERDAVMRLERAGLRPTHTPMTLQCFMCTRPYQCGRCPRLPGPPVDCSQCPLFRAAQLAAKCRHCGGSLVATGEIGAAA